MKYIGKTNHLWLMGFYLVLAALIGAGVVSVVISGTGRNTGKATAITGAYSLDGGDWRDTDDNGLNGGRFETARIRGWLTEIPDEDEYLIIQVANAWLDVYAYGKQIGTNRRGADSFLPHTAGNSILYIPAERLQDDGMVEVVLTREPRPVASGGWGDILTTLVGSKEALYNRLIHLLPLAALCLLLSFSGLISFGIAGFIMRGIDFRYLTYAAAALFGGLYLCTDAVYRCLPLLFENPAACLIMDEAISYAFLIAVLSFVRASLKKHSHRQVANAMILLFVLMSAAAMTLQFTDTLTLYQSDFVFDLVFIVSCIILSGLLFREFKTNEDAKYVLISWIPIGLAVLFSIFNAWFHLTGARIPMSIGIALTLLNQIIRLILALRAQYYANLEYEHMQKELYEARVAIMVSQIQPHFLYNSLTSIAMLCTKDPKRARTATINFADYLRGNMNSLKERNPVPFKQELAHLKKYLMLEEMRFGDLLHIEYDIQCSDFLIPQLSVQPLVENAVKHGVGMKEDGGTVTISTRETDDSYLVEVRDDGVGFDPSVPKNDGRSHVGMENVRSRLKEMVNGRVEITSEPGKGTTAVIIIPKEETES